MKRKIDAMHAEYGYGSGFCRDCCNFSTGKYRGMTPRKCEAYGITHSEATDWAGKYLACGLYNKPWAEMRGQRTMIEMHEHAPRAGQEPPLEGQVGMF